MPFRNIPRKEAPLSITSLEMAVPFINQNKPPFNLKIGVHCTTLLTHKEKLMSVGKLDL